MLVGFNLVQNKLELSSVLLAVLPVPAGCPQRDVLPNFRPGFVINKRLEFVAPNYLLVKLCTSRMSEVSAVELQKQTTRTDRPRGGIFALPAHSLQRVRLCEAGRYWRCVVYIRGCIDQMGVQTGAV